MRSEANGRRPARPSGSAGEILAIEAEQGRLRAEARPELGGRPLACGLDSRTAPIGTDQQRGALRRLADAILGRRDARTLLGRATDPASATPPRVRGSRQGMRSTDGTADVEKLRELVAASTSYLHPGTARLRQDLHRRPADRST